MEESLGKSGHSGGNEYGDVDPIARQIRDLYQWDVGHGIALLDNSIYDK